MARKRTVAFSRNAVNLFFHILTRCNLNCRHCAVANIRRTDYPMSRVSADMADLYRRGCRILFLYGGEPFLWRDGDLRLVDLVAEARRIGAPLRVIDDDALAWDVDRPTDLDHPDLDRPDVDRPDLDRPDSPDA